MTIVTSSILSTESYFLVHPDDILAEPEPNLIPQDRASFEIDSDSNGRADGWNSYVSGLAVTGLGFSRVTSPAPKHGSWVQRVGATHPGGGTSRYGISYSVSLLSPSTDYFVTAYLAGTGGTIFAHMEDAVRNYFQKSYSIGSNTVFTPVVIPFTTPDVTTTISTLYFWNQSANVGGSDLYVEAVHLSLARRKKARTIKLYHVTADSFSDEYEEETHQLIGRGRKTDYGTRLGYQGSMSAALFDNATLTASEQRDLLESAKEDRTHWFLKNPFGDGFYVTLGNLQFNRAAGTGLREHLNVQFSYTEVV